jgi:propionate CoA-transferase
MNILTETALLARMAGWALSLIRYDTHYPSPVPENSKFMSPRDAVRLIGDRSVVAASGLGAHQRASILYRAIRESFARTGHPRRLTVVNVGGHGSRGLLPGTIDELAQPGLCARFVTSHFETFRAMQDLAAAGKCQLQCLPLGIMSLLFDALSRGNDSVVSETGVGTFLDPRGGRGSPVTGRRQEQLIAADGNRLRYRMPPIDVALFNVPAADRRGNLYLRNCAIQGDSYEIARAAKRNGGRVIANVGLLVDEGYDRVFLPARSVDAVVYYPYTEQTVGFFHRNPWPAVTTGGSVPIQEALDHARLARWFGEAGGALAKRTAVDDAMARLAAVTLFSHVGKGAEVALGAGLPEEVGRVVFECGRLNDVTFLVESGVVGGLPAPGAYFGAAFSPHTITSTAQLFKRCYRKLDAACLGALEVDGAGNVNVSKRGPGVRNYAGPGGFMDFTAAARVLVFVAGWTRHGDLVVEGGAIRQRRHGAPKFVRRVAEVTFDGHQALRAGKKVFWVTSVGVFHLSKRGMELSQVMPGIDVRKDIIDATPMKIVLPRSGEVPLVSRSIVTGDGFTLPRHCTTEATPLLQL